MHARIDTLTCLHFWSLLPLSVFDWVVIAVSVCDVRMPLNTLIHPMSIISTTLQAVFTGLSSFRLVPIVIYIDHCTLCLSTLYLTTASRWIKFIHCAKRHVLFSPFLV